MEHIVHHGETLSSIANRYGVTVAAIMQANRLHSHYIHSGQRLWIPVQAHYHAPHYQAPYYQPHYQGPTQHVTHTHTHTHTHTNQ
jgi:LysM repeat protein